MNKLLNIIEENIDNSINEYISMISKTYNLNIKELKDLWNSRSNLMSQPMELEPPIQQIKYSSPSSPSSTKSTKSTK